MCKGGRLLQMVIIIGVFILLGRNAYSQALLPKITVYYKNGKNYITWKSGYTSIRQIGVQRSQDSLFNYATIGHAAQPNKKVNEFIDSHPQSGKNFYRLFILFTNNSYFFSDPTAQIPAPTTFMSKIVNPNKVQPPLNNKPQIFSPSIYVYTNSEGNVNISLAGAPGNHYDIRFFDSDDHFLFDLKNIRKPYLILDKSNFMRTGWYHFTLFENGRLKERWKFYIGDSVDK